MPKPLFAFLAVLEEQPTGIEPGIFRSEQKKALAFLNLETCTQMEVVFDPYTCNTMVPMGYDSPTYIYSADFTGSSTLTPHSLRLDVRKQDWHTSASDIWMTEPRWSSFPSSITYEECPRVYLGPARNSVDIHIYRTSARDFADYSLDFLWSILTMVSYTPRYS